MIVRKVFIVFMRIAALTVAVAGYIAGIRFDYMHAVDTLGEMPGMYKMQFSLLCFYLPMMIASVPGALLCSPIHNKATLKSWAASTWLRNNTDLSGAAVCV